MTEIHLFLGRTNSAGLGLAIPSFKMFDYPCVISIIVAVLIPQWCPTLCNPMGCSRPGSSVCGILQARILGWVAMPSSRGSSQLRDWTNICYIFCIGRQIFYHWPPPGKPCLHGILRQKIFLILFFFNINLFTLVFLPGQFHGQKTLGGYSPRGHKKSDAAQWLNNNSNHTGLYLLDASSSPQRW